jgi:hypothetical protein
MTTSYENLVVQQMVHARPSPTLEVSKALDVNSSYSPGHTPCPSPMRDHACHGDKDQQYFSPRPHHVAPPSTPITSPQRSTTTVTNNATPTVCHSGEGASTISTTAQADTNDNDMSTPDTQRVLPPPVKTSPRGVTDVFSLSTDKQLAAEYSFVEQIGYGNWVR